MAPRPRFEKLPESKRAAILRAAAGEFAAHGYGGASYNRIIAVAGVSKGAMYYYFDDKMDLFKTTVRRVVGELFAEFEGLPQVEDAGTFWAEMERLVERSMDLWAARPELAGLLFAAEELRRGGQWDQEVEAALVGEGMDWFDRIYDMGQRVGAIRTDLPDDFLKSLLWAVGEAQDLWFARHHKDYTLEELTALMGKFLRIWRRIAEPEELAS